MVGNEANLCPSIARQLVQLVHEGVTEGAQVARLQGRSRHVEQEQVDGRLGRPRGQRQPRLLQQGLRLGNLGQGRPENLGAAVRIVPLLGLKAWLWWRHLLGGKDVPVLKQVQAFLAPHLLEPILCDTQTSQLENSCFVTLMLYC